MNTTNSFTMTGRLGADAKVFNLTNSNKAVFNIAIDRKDGDKQTTQWFPVEAYSKDKDKFDNLKKGQLLEFTGFHSIWEHDDKEGKHCKDIILVATSWEQVSFGKKEEKEKEAE